MIGFGDSFPEGYLGSIFVCRFYHLTIVFGHKFAKFLFFVYQGSTFEFGWCIFLPKFFQEGAELCLNLQR